RWSGSGGTEQRVALAAGAMIMYLLLHFNRIMLVLKRAADQPVGYVASAVMLNAKLKPKATLLHVIAMTRALGELRSPRDQQPEVFRWTDGGNSWVEGVFVNGKLAEWKLVRPDAPDDACAQPDDAPSADAVRPGAADALRPPV
ncbi:MAG: hypothetical protein WKG52_19110, partial [Variovorax sp.]